MRKYFNSISLLTRSASQIAGAVPVQVASNHTPMAPEATPDRATASTQLEDNTFGSVFAQFSIVRVVLSEIQRQSEWLPEKSFKPIHTNGVICDS